MNFQRSISSKIAVLIMLMVMVNNQLKANEYIHQTGNYLQFFLPATAVTLAICYKDKEGAIQLAETLSLTLGVTYALKYSINEERPNGENFSFPSGHTSMCFSTAEFIRSRYGWGYGAPAYLLASFAGYSRIDANEHYIQDVVAGAFIGILSSRLFTTPYKGWQISMDGDTKNIGFQFSRKF